MERLSFETLTKVTKASTSVKHPMVSVQESAKSSESLSMVNHKGIVLVLCQSVFHSLRFSFFLRLHAERGELNGKAFSKS